MKNVSLVELTFLTFQLEEKIKVFGQGKNEDNRRSNRILVSEN